METTVSLVQMLDARERRVQHQQELHVYKNKNDFERRRYL